VVSPYYSRQHVEDQVRRGFHREIIGAMWDEIGDLQFELLKANGMQPHHTLLDLGCGSLRLGVKAVGYLDAGNYWGTDLNQELLDAGYDKELAPLGLTERLPRSNLVRDTDFEFAGIPKQIDFVMANSVFTHLPLNHLRLCLARLDAHLTGPCTFFFTLFCPTGGKPVAEASVQKDGIVTFPHKDPYHHMPEDAAYLAKRTDWKIDFIGDWQHPRNQQLVRATR